jgi:polyhydroxyalkanoate synthase
LREFYQNNRLARGEMTIGGVKLDLKKVMLPIYELAAREDHIAPAISVFKGAKLYGGPVRYVLAGSGHIAGVINPPASGKYMHWVPGGEDSKAWAGLEEWLSAATEVAGSWWPDYAKWLSALSGEEMPARIPGQGANQPLDDAPGSYVKG